MLRLVAARRRLPRRLVNLRPGRTRMHQERDPSRTSVLPVATSSLRIVAVTFRRAGICHNYLHCNDFQPTPIRVSVPTEAPGLPRPSARLRLFPARAPPRPPPARLLPLSPSPRSECLTPPGPHDPVSFLPARFPPPPPSPPTPAACLPPCFPLARLPSLPRPRLNPSTPRALPRPPPPRRRCTPSSHHRHSRRRRPRRRCPLVRCRRPGLLRATCPPPPPPPVR